ncbi:RNA ligase family protein [Thalassoroseus pseudoceratinae]|uniref:RNA ligase family protein n=1 Tax=Thalassoroseus pseudoceratinae TaxID=2713176 RepID=UPI00141EFD3A|nr:RNA ligase family protein [Thalassoroseus pseudoceratinae]
MRLTRDLDLRKLNSTTKYPSIPTYHSLGDRGSLLNETVSFDGHPLIATEKVDGTNSRIIIMPDECYLIGSREELLHAKGDLVHNPALGIVETLKPAADRISSAYQSPQDAITTIYLETYGGKTTAAAKQYTSRREFGFRVFDVNRVPISRLDSELAVISSWRENGGQDFLSEAALTEFTEAMQLKLTPRVTGVDFIPTAIGETHDWLQSKITTTLVALDEDAGGKPEGLVVRTADRERIVKIRFEDYERHAKRLKKQMKN